MVYYSNKRGSMKIRFIMAVCLAFLTALQGFAAETIGEAVYIEGDVTVVRDGEDLDASDVQIGMDIENFDLLRTGPRALAEIKITSTRAPAMTIKMSSNTQFSFELSKLGIKTQSSIGLITGSLSLKVSKLTGTQAVNVKTDSAAMGVRGTGFTVSAPSSGDILVTCDEGEVVCVEEGGEELAITPGKAVEKKEGERFRAIPVAVSDLETFRKNWSTERIASLKSNALRAIQNYGKIYLALSEELNSNFAILMKQQAILNKWAQEDKAGKVGGKLDAMKEKKEIVGILFKLRKTLFRFERIYYRLVELREYYDQGYGKGFVQPGMTTDQFFRRMDGEKKELEKKMNKIRQIARLYAERNDGRAPTGAFDDDNQDESDFFDEPEF
jgi:hypothetical protein